MVINVSKNSVSRMLKSAGFRPYHLTIHQTLTWNNVCAMCMSKNNIHIGEGLGNPSPHGPHPPLGAPPPDALGLTPFLEQVSINDIFYKATLRCFPSTLRSSSRSLITTVKYKIVINSETKSLTKNSRIY